MRRGSNRVGGEREREGEREEGEKGSRGRKVVGGEREEG